MCSPYIYIFMNIAIYSKATTTSLLECVLCLTPPHPSAEILPLFFLLCDVIHSIACSMLSLYLALCRRRRRQAYGAAMREARTKNQASRLLNRPNWNWMDIERSVVLRRRRTVIIMTLENFLEHAVCVAFAALPSLYHPRTHTHTHTYSYSYCDAAVWDSPALASLEGASEMPNGGSSFACIALSEKTSEARGRGVKQAEREESERMKAKER